jgi:uncharacterized protein YlxW (UPF0749 family)
VIRRGRLGDDGAALAAGIRGERGAGHPFAMHARRSQLTVAAVACLLGLLVVVQLRTQTADSGLQNKSAQDLTGLVGNLNTENDRLRAEIGGLQDQLSELNGDHSAGVSSVEQIQTELAKIRAWTGLDPVAGRGVNLTVTGDIDATGVNDLLNELRNAGAEAIAIEDVRAVARTTVSGVPGSLDVGGFLLRDPFHIRAIGKPETLVGSLTRSGGILAQLAATNPEVTIVVEPIDQRMTLPATRQDLVPSHGHPRV